MMFEPKPQANERAVEQLTLVEPVLVGIAPAHEAMNLPRTTVLTSGPPLPFSHYTGGQRAAVIGGARYENLGASDAEVIEKFDAGEIDVDGCQAYNCVGSLAGVTTASMPVLIVEDANTGERAFCTLYEGDASDRLNYGSYTENTQRNLEHLRTVVAPALNELIQQQRATIALKPIMSRALTMGDDLHSRNAAATLLLFRHMLTGISTEIAGLSTALQALKDDYFFLRISMAASKLMANAMRNVEGSTIITAMAFSCKEFGIQVSGLGDRWFTGAVPVFEDYKIEDGFDIADMEIMGGESVITEVCGLGGMAQAAAFPLVRASGGDVQRMVQRTTEMYDVTFTESPDFFIPSLNYRGVPLGIDLQKVIETGQTPYLNIGMAGKSKRQIGGGVAVAPIEAFQAAWKEFSQQ